MKSQPYTQLQRRYGGLFIALYEGRVTASAKSSKTLFRKITTYLGDPSLLVQYVAPERAACIY